MKLTIKDLKTFAKQQARLSGADYGGDSKAYRMDRNNILKARRSAMLSAEFHWHHEDTPLVAGEYFGGRLIITDSSLEYVAGQYAPTEIYHAIQDYFKRTRAVE